MIPSFTTTPLYPYYTRQAPTPMSSGLTQVKSNLQFKQTANLLAVGLLFANNSAFARSLMGFGQSAPAINLALQTIASQQLLPSINLTFQWYMDNCEESLAAGYASRLIVNDNVNTIIGPSCPKSNI